MPKDIVSAGSGMAVSETWVASPAYDLLDGVEVSVKEVLCE
jgi:hypothetical protein